MTRFDGDDEAGRDIALSKALRSLRPVLRAADVDRLTARIMSEVAIPIGKARAAAHATWWAVTANWAKVAVPAALAAGIGFAAVVSQLPESVIESPAVASNLGVISHDTAAASLESMATPYWLQEDVTVSPERSQ